MAAMPAFGLTAARFRSAEARSKPICAATIPQVTVGCTPEPVMRMPERTTLPPSLLVTASASSRSPAPSSGNLLGPSPVSSRCARFTSGCRLMRSIGTMASALPYFG